MPENRPRRIPSAPAHDHFQLRPVDQFAESIHQGHADDKCQYGYERWHVPDRFSRDRSGVSDHRMIGAQIDNRRHADAFQPLYEDRSPRCRMIGQADDVVIITENCYGGYSARIKNILDRSIGTSTPMSTYRAGEMHHTLRYGKKGLIKVIVYGDISDNEKATWELMIERNRINHGYRTKELVFVDSVNDLEVSKL